MFNIFKKNTINSHYGLADIHTGTLIVISQNFQNINILSQYVNDVRVVLVPTSSNLQRFLYNQIKPGDSVRFAWNNSSEKVVLNKNITDELIKKSLLVNIQFTTLNTIIRHIINLRSRTRNTLLFQDNIYLKKRIQAEAFRNNDYKEENILRYPYVLQYADFANISMKQAADEILLKANIEDSTLAKTELLRMTYVNMIKDIKNQKDADNVYDAFLRDFNIKI